ncbi:MAG: chemotaxis response regulator protein-glutamate methylesterase [Gammaproteobacteria bacterium]
MAVRVLVVDDSGFFRRRITEILSSDSRLEVVGSAEDGAEAVRQVKALKPDVVTMDIEMPVLDGISAVRRIMAEQPTPVLMFSTLSYEGGKATLDALEAGAVDFLPKRFEDMARDRESGAKTLCARVYELGSGRRVVARRPAPAATPSPATAPAVAVAGRERAAPAVAAPAPARPQTGKLRGVRLVAIGASTGGPVALQQVLSALPASFPVPIVLIQHMPANFTRAFAERLDQQCEISVKEAEDGDELRPGLALLAPGGKQMLLERSGTRARVMIQESKPGMTYKPYVDITFGSAARAFGNGVLSIVLTGMGADGREGARLLKQGGSHVWAQDEQSCVIYGMPGAVVQSNLADRVLPLKEIGEALVGAL